MRRPGPLDNGEPLHAIDPDGKTRPDDVVLDEIRSAGGESQKEGQEGIDREVGRRAFAVQILAAAHRASLTRNRNEPAKGQTLTVEAS